MTMKTIKIFLAICLIFLIFSCNVQSIRKSRLQNAAEKQQSAQVDSFLYYQPIALNDPFLDSLKSQHDVEQAIKIRVIPPAAAPKPTTKMVEGYRVQTFAGIDSLNALVMVNNLKAVLEDSIYFFKEKDHEVLCSTAGNGPSHNNYIGVELRPQINRLLVIEVR